MQIKKMKEVLLMVLSIITLILSIINIKMIVKVVEKTKDLKSQKNLEEELQKLSTEYYQNSYLKEITNISSFFTVKSCTEEYFSVINNLWYNDDYNLNINKYNKVNQYEFEFNDYASIRLYNLLAKNYKDEEKLNTNSIKEKYNSFFIQDKTIINNVYEYDINTSVTAFIVSGNNFCKDGSNKADFVIMILIDRMENSFEVYPEEYIKKHNLDNSTLNSKIQEVCNVQKIENNQYNTIQTEILTNPKIIDYYFELYKFNMKYNIEVAYNMLNKTYREKRFGTLENYIKYIQENQTKLNSTLDSYKINYVFGYKQYICIDKNGYYYIFSPEDKCLDYNIMLDTYTLDIDEFTDKYYKAKEYDRVALNIQKIFDALNCKDYNYVYNKLADGFKKNYFNTLEDFEKYAKENFYVENEVEYLGYTKESEEYYSYIIKIKDKKTNETKGLKIIMELKSGTDFVMSFNVE